MVKKVLRGFVILVIALLVLAAGAVASVYGISSYHMNKTYNIPVKSFAVPTDQASIEHGQHLLTAIGKCTDCHGAHMQGQVFIDNANGFGRFVAANVTTGKGGLGSTLSTDDLVKVLRHGVKPDGTPVRFMPVDDYVNFSDADLAAIIATIKHLKPVDNELPPTTVGPIGRALYATGNLPSLLPAEIIDHEAHPSAPPAGITPEYGHYLAATGGCLGCHGPGLSGGQVPGTPAGDPKFPPAANISPTGIGKWSEADFFKALRQGHRPDGSAINPFMPWALAGQMTDDEIKAIWIFLKTVPPKETGNR